MDNEVYFDLDPAILAMPITMYLMVELSPKSVPYKCGKRWMASTWTDCVIEDGKIVKGHFKEAAEWFNTKEEAEAWQKNHKEYDFTRNV